MRLLIPLLLLLLAGTSQGQRQELYALQDRLLKGELEALRELGKRFDSKTEVIDHLGYHRIESTEGSIAKRIVEELSFFLDDEFKFYSITTTAEFMTFMDQHKGQLVFSEEVNAFLITPFSERETTFEIHDITENRKRELDQQRGALFSKEWVVEAGIYPLVEQGDPRALETIAAEFLRTRGRWNTQQWNSEEYTDLIELLTHTRIATPDASGHMSPNIASDFQRESRMNLLTFFATNLENYSWDSEKELFVFEGSTVVAVSPERALFETLDSKDDDEAISAFIELTTSDPAQVAQLADEYEDNFRFSKNFNLPTFAFRFLKQLSQLTAYCREEGIDYTGSPELNVRLDSLRQFLPFRERYQLEERLIRELTFNDITALEYWALVYENGFTLTFSAGKILDRFYSNHWEEIVNDPRQLRIYLKKARLYDDLGIVGVCNLYSRKFLNSTPSTIDRLNGITTTDEDIEVQLKKTLKMAAQPLPTVADTHHAWSGSEFYGPPVELKRDIKLICAELADQENYMDSATVINKAEKAFAMISYDQIPEAIKLAGTVPYKWPGRAYDFLEDDFGFIGYKFSDEKERNQFLAAYKSMNERELYAHLLDRIGVKYKTPSGELDYDNLYDRIKYGIVTPLAGGGNSTQDRETYCLIKLLELQFKTTLGFPNKMCFSQGMFNCSTDNQVNAWMRYLSEHNLLKRTHDEPITFTYGL